MPSKWDKLIKRYALTKNHSEAERSCLKEGEEEVVDDDEEWNGRGENNGQQESNGDATGKWQLCLCGHCVWWWSVLNLNSKKIDEFIDAFFLHDVISPK